QLARVADHVGLHFPQPYPRAAERSEVVALVVEVRSLALVDEDLERYAEFPAVAEHAGVPVRQPPRSAVVVLAIGKLAYLRFSPGADLGVRGTAAQRPVHPADAIARLEDVHVVSELRELVA